MEQHKASRETGFIYKLLEDGRQQWGGHFLSHPEMEKESGSVCHGRSPSAPPHPAEGRLVWNGTGLPHTIPGPPSIRGCGGAPAECSCCGMQGVSGMQLHCLSRAVPLVGGHGMLAGFLQSSTAPKALRWVMAKSCTAPTVRVSSLGWRAAPIGGQVGG